MVWTASLIDYSPIPLDALQNLQIRLHAHAPHRQRIFLSTANILPLIFPSHLLIQIVIFTGRYDPLIGSLLSRLHSVMYDPSLIDIFRYNCALKDRRITLSIEVRFTHFRGEIEDIEEVAEAYRAIAQDLFSDFYSIHSMDFELKIVPREA